METKTISIPEGNKLIAEFDGWISTGRKHPFDESKGFTYRKKGNMGEMWVKGFTYDENWNALMPVIEKIESLGFYVSIQKSNVTCCKDGGISPVYENYGYKNKRQAVWEAVVAFIELHNNNNK